MSRKSLIAASVVVIARNRGAVAFAPALSHPTTTNNGFSDVVSLQATISNASGDGISRRDALTQTSSLGLVSALLSAPAPAARAESSSGNTMPGSSPEHPIVVLGAGGRVGALCTQILADRGLYVRATTRSGRPVLLDEEGGTSSPYISYAAADVTNWKSVQTALTGASGVLFAASASGKKKGDEPQDVEFLGAYYTAKACLMNGVPKLVLISSAAVTRPNSLGFKATNFSVKYIYGDRMMDAKIAGEAAVRDLYADGTMNPSGRAAYSIVRPGGLQDRPESAGPSNIHVSQGDVYASEIGRIDVALVCVAALLKGRDTDFTTFELNLVEGLTKCQRGLPDLPPDLVHAGASSVDGLLTGLLTDAEIKAKYPELINNFRGDGLAPLKELIA